MALLRTCREALIGRREVLPEELAAAYPELRTIRLRRGGLLPRVGGWCLGQGTVSGITAWSTVVLGRGVPVTAELLLHELAHVRQFHALRAFPLRYWWESLTRGYAANRYEVAARQFVVERLRERADRRFLLE